MSRRKRSVTRLASLLLAAAACCWPSPVLAEDGEDGAYGRLDGDLGIGLEVGVSEQLPGEMLMARLGCHYLHTVGLFGQYEDGLGLAAPRAARTLGLGVEVRPLFLARFASDLERGPALLDLWLDSLALELATVAAEVPREDCSAGRPCWHGGIHVGLGVELPLLARAQGPFVGLRGALRWPAGDGRTDDPEPLGHPTALVSLSLGYRLVLAAHLVDAGDRLR